MLVWSRVRVVAVGFIVAIVVVVGVQFASHDKVGRGVTASGGPRLVPVTAAASVVARQDREQQRGHERFLRAAKHFLVDNVVETSTGAGEPIFISVSADVSVDEFAEIKRVADRSRVAYRIRTVSPRAFQVDQLGG